MLSMCGLLYLRCRTPCGGVRRTEVEVSERNDTLAGGPGGMKLFLVHGDGGAEEDEEGGSQKGEAQE